MLTIGLCYSPQTTDFSLKVVKKGLPFRLCHLPVKIESEVDVSFFRDSLSIKSKVLRSR